MKRLLIIAALLAAASGIVSNLMVSRRIAEVAAGSRGTVSAMIWVPYLGRYTVTAPGDRSDRGEGMPFWAVTWFVGHMRLGRPPGA